MNSEPSVSVAPAFSVPRGASLLRGAVLQSFSEMTLGQLRMELPDASVRHFGEPADAPARRLPLDISAKAQISVRRECFFKKCLLAGDIGFAESYIDGDWDTPDLPAVIAWFILNLEHAPTLSGSKKARSLALNFLRFTNRVGHLLRPNSRAKARRNISEHYDLSNDFFALFLDRSMMYSAARWDRADFTLEQAQAAKNNALCEKLRLKPTDRVLEIGSGWGGWSIHAAKNYGCHVTTVTISQQQFELARRRVQEAGVADRVEVQFMDYRDLRGEYDKIVSIEMMEAIGHRYLPDFAAALDRLLRQDGLLALQFITCPDARYDEFRRGVDFIQKHIFPGSLLLSVNRVNSMLTSHGGFSLYTIEDLGHDYARTLRCWKEKFNARLAEVQALGFDARFVRKWNYYLAYCEAAFALRNISVVQTLHTRANNLSI